MEREVRQPAAEAAGEHSASIDPTSSLGIYANADARTRRLIEQELNRVNWHARQQIYLQWAGLISGFLISAAFLACGVILAFKGHPAPGTIIASVDVVALAAVFVTRSWRPSN
jgi:hypothetical protein